MDTNSTVRRVVRRDGVGILQPERPCREQFFNQQSIAILLDESIPSEGYSRLTRQATRFKRDVPYKP